MTPIRSFIAIELSNEARAALTDLQRRLKAIASANTVRWITPERLHLTLHFLGDLTANDVATVSELLQSAGSAYQPFDLTLAGLGCFPKMQRPRIVWVGISGDTVRLVKLHQELGQKLKVINFTPEARPYSPHLTIGRVKQDLPQRQLLQLGQALAQEQAQVGQLASLPVTGISLMKSELKPTGAVYTQLAHASLIMNDEL